MPSLRAFGDCSLGEATRHLSGVHTIQMDPLLDVELVIVDDNCVEGRWWKSESWIWRGRQDAFGGRSLQAQLLASHYFGSLISLSNWRQALSIVSFFGIYY
jgi:hypothetical protein